MTTRELRLRAVREQARGVVAEFSAKERGPIDLEQLAAAHGAEIVFDDLEGATARVIRIGSGARIFISTRITDPGSIRFSIAHELAHLLLSHRVPHGAPGRLIERVCSPLQPDGSNPEREASVYASELLMPEADLRDHCAIAPSSLAPIHAIAKQFRTSVLASAMRFVELTQERCAVVYTELGSVRWVKPSATFGAWIPKGRAVDPTSAAFDYFDRGVIDHGSRTLSGEAWLSRRSIEGSEVSIVEHSTVVPELGAVFSLLWIPRDTSAPLAMRG
jgi:hypothetical protein